MMQKITGLFLFCLSFLTGNAQSGSRVSRAFAVVVGINEYQDDNFPSLKYAASDAKRFYAFLKNFYGLDTSNGNVKLLINENATRANILNQVSQLFNRSAEENNDVLIFYFSGHGTNSEVTNDGYLLTQDADNKALASTAISMNEIRNRLESSKSRIKLCFIDACHAGIFYKSGKGAKEDQTALVNERLENLSKGLPGSVIFLSSTERLESQEVDSLKSGRFTYYLLHGLEGDADKYAKSETGRNDGRVSVGEMMDYIYDEIYESSKYEQRPFVYASIEDSTALNIISHKPGLPEGIGRAKDAIIVRSTRPGSSDDARKSLTNMGVLWNGKNFLDALKDGDEQIVTLFLAGGMRAETAESDGRSLAIMLALNTFNPEKMVDILMSNHFDINQTFKQYAPGGDMQTNLLGSAIEHGNVKLVVALLKNKINPNKPVDTYGMMGIATEKYPLQSAIYWKQTDIAFLILKAKCDISVGNYAAYQEAYFSRNNYFWKNHQEDMQKILQATMPPQNKSAKINAELRLGEIDAELTDVAKKSLQSYGNPYQKNEYDKKYDELLAEKQKLLAIVKKAQE